MSDNAKIPDARAVWKDQPQEDLAVNVQEFAGSRAAELHSNTRSEILSSVGASLFFIAMMAWRLPPVRPAEQVGFAAVAAWALITLWWFRGSLRRPEPPPPDTLAASGLDFYRRELARRRGHLRNEWIWHGPLLLAFVLFVLTLSDKSFIGPDRLLSIVPLVLLLAAWVGYSIWKRLRLARAIQAEMDELDRGDSDAR